MRYVVVIWSNNGDRLEHGAETLTDAEAIAQSCRTLGNRTVKIGHNGDAIRHWSRTLTAKRNHWAKHSTFECAR